MFFAAAIVFHASRFFTKTSTTGHHVDWNASWSSMTKLWGGSTASDDPRGTECDRSMVRGLSMQWPRTGQCSVSAGGENPTGIRRYTLLTTGPLGGRMVAGAPAVQAEPPLSSCPWASCPWAQKNGCEYSSCTTLPSNHASVNPMWMQPFPPSRHGSATPSDACAERALDTHMLPTASNTTMPSRNDETRARMDMSASLVSGIGVDCSRRRGGGVVNSPHGKNAHSGLRSVSTTAYLARPTRG